MVIGEDDDDNGVADKISVLPAKWFTHVIIFQRSELELPPSPFMFQQMRKPSQPSKQSPPANFPSETSNPRIPEEIF